SGGRGTGAARRLRLRLGRLCGGGPGGDPGRGGPHPLGGGAGGGRPVAPARPRGGGGGGGGVAPGRGRGGGPGGGGGGGGGAASRAGGRGGAARPSPPPREAGWGGPEAPARGVAPRVVRPSDREATGPAACPPGGSRTPRPRTRSHRSGCCRPSPSWGRC